MKVVYKKTILEKIDEEIFESYKLNKEIEKIVMSQEEWEEMYNEIKQTYIYPVIVLDFGDETKYRGIPIYVE